MMLNMYSRMLVKGYRNLSLPIFFPSNLFHSSISFNNKRESTVFKFPKLLALNNLQYVDGSRKKVCFKDCFINVLTIILIREKDGEEVQDLEEVIIVNMIFKNLNLF